MSMSVPHAARRFAWLLAAFLAGFAFVAILLTVSRLAFPLVLGTVESVADGRFVDGAVYAAALVLWAFIGMLLGALVHMGAEAALAKAQALRVVPLAVINPQPKENR